MPLFKIEARDTYSYCRPVCEVTLNEGIRLLCEIVEECVRSDIRKILIDITGVTGFKMPDTFDRYALGTRLAASSKGMVTVAFVVCAEVIDPQRFGMLVARNRGLIGELFTSEQEAVVWLSSLPRS